MKRSILLGALALILAIGTSAPARAGATSSTPLPNGETKKTGFSAWLPLIVGGAIGFGALGAIILFRWSRRSAPDSEMSEDRQFNALNQAAAQRPNRTMKLVLSALILIGMVAGVYIFRAPIAAGLTEVGTTIITPFLHVTPRPSSS
jgi:hypothetical protein